MTKEDLVNEIGNALRSRKQAEAALDSLLKNITDTLKAGDSVMLTGFGTFKVVQRNARKGRNPQTGEEIQIEAKRAPVFKAGKQLVQAINKSAK